MLPLSLASYVDVVRYSFLDTHYELQLHCINPLYFGTSPQNLSSSPSFQPHFSAKGSRLSFITSGRISRSPFFSTRSMSSSRIQERGTNCETY